MTMVKTYDIRAFLKQQGIKCSYMTLLLRDGQLFFRNFCHPLTHFYFRYLLLFVGIPIQSLEKMLTELDRAFILLDIGLSAQAITVSSKGSLSVHALIMDHNTVQHGVLGHLTEVRFTTEDIFQDPNLISGTACDLSSSAAWCSTSMRFTLSTIRCRTPRHLALPCPLRFSSVATSWAQWVHP